MYSYMSLNLGWLYVVVALKELEVNSIPTTLIRMSKNNVEVSSQKWGLVGEEKVISYWCIHHMDPVILTHFN